MEWSRFREEAERMPRWIGHPLLTALLGAFLATAVYRLVMAAVNSSTWIHVISAIAVVILFLWLFASSFTIWRGRRNNAQAVRHER